MELRIIEIIICLHLGAIIVLLKSAYNDINKNYSKIPKSKEPKIMSILFYEMYEDSAPKPKWESDIFRVRLFIDCEYQAGADYVTDKYTDAMLEKDRIKERAQITDKTTDLAKLQQALYIEQLEKEQIK